MTNYANIRYQPSAASTTTVADMAALIALTGMSNGDQALVQATNKLYMYSGTGWYLIATIQNDAPSAITGVNGTYELAIDGTATTITAASTDPEGFPLTWSYSTSGLGSIATISNTDNVFTITPSTTEADAGTFSLTINATDGVNGAVSTSTSLTLNFIIIVQYSRYTTLLATATDTSDNNNITDASSNSHNITVNGDAHAGTFSPYRSGGYSTSFDGSNDYLKTPSSDFYLSTGQFSAEVWIKPSDLSGNKLIFIDTNYNLYTANTQVRWWSDIVHTGSAGIALLSVGKWTHLLVTRDSNNTLRIFADGILLHVATNHTHNYGTSNTAFELSYSGGNKFAGEMRDARIISGSIPSDYQTSSTTTTSSSAVITVPTEPLTAVSGTKLLACNQPYLGYTTASATGYFNTIGGNTSTKPFSPYDYEEYSATDHGGSVYFDGTGDALRIADNSNIQLGTSPFTIEGWFYCTNTTPTQGILAKRDTSGEYWRWIIAGGNLNFRFQSAGGGSFTFNNVSVPANTWCHFAVTRDSNSDVRQFVNGISTQTAINSTGNFDISGSTLRVGEYELNTGHFNGFVSDIKIVKNSAIYTSDFTPPTAPLSSSGTTLHIKGPDASIIDKSQVSNLKLVGNTTGSTTQVKFAGSKSMYFDGSGDYIITPQQELGTEDFTIEGWHYLLTRANNRNGIFGNYTSYEQWSLGMFAGHSSATTTSYQVAYNGDTFPANVIQGGTIAYNQWVHFAVVRNSGTMNLYINGTSVDSISATASLNGVGSNLIVGAPGDNLADGMHGYLEDFRITKGLARYTANFTPPTEPLEG